MSADQAAELAREIARFVYGKAPAKRKQLHVDAIAALLRPHLGERWISVSERLPEKDVYVWAWNPLWKSRPFVSRWDGRRMDRLQSFR